jgi:hypothetical protein
MVDNPAMDAMALAAAGPQMRGEVSREGGPLVSPVRERPR